jgi:long-chain acyl-CoA synthetase
MAATPAPSPPEPLFFTVAERIAAHARARPGAPAVADAAEALDWAGLDRTVDRVAAGLQAAGVRPGEAVAIAAGTTVPALAVFLGALRAGAVAVPLATNVPSPTFASMLADSGARILFAGDEAAALAPDAAIETVPLRSLDELAAWLPAADARPETVPIEPAMPFNVIYSSGTTGTPKGIVQPHGMRWRHVLRGADSGYGPEATTLVATPLYSNTTLVSLLPSLAWGGRVVLMEKFDVERYLALAEAERATHTMLVPVQYRRLLASPRFDATDLAAFRTKFCTSAPFGAALKAEILARWPGGLVEYYGMTEGGGTCILKAHERPDKLHTVGRPSEGHDIRVIDEQGRELPPGEAGEVVGRSGAMMTGYHGQPAKTAEATWTEPATGARFIRTGDVGRFDPDGFLVLLDRRKDMVISGGFNVYPSDLEAALEADPAVAEAAVVGVPSERWGETPVGFVVARAGAALDGPALLADTNARLGKTQRLSALHVVDALPRSAIGKVLKTDLRRLAADGTAHAPADL